MRALRKSIYLRHDRLVHFDMNTHKSPKMSGSGSHRSSFIPQTLVFLLVFDIDVLGVDDVAFVRCRCRTAVA